MRLLGAAIEKGLTRRIALLADGIFQAIGLEKAEILVKELLNFIEYPSADYEKVIVLVSSSERVTRAKVGRHLLANIHAIWNLAREGFMQLYGLPPSSEPSPEIAWKWTGGNPRALSLLHQSRSDPNTVLYAIIASRGLKR